MTTPSLASRLIRDTGHAASGRLASIAFWLLATPPILRRLGAVEFALWAIFLAIAGYLTGLDLGLAQGTLRHVAASRATRDDRSAAAHVALGLGGYLALGLAWVAILLLLARPAMSWLQVPPALTVEARWALLGGAVVFTVAGWCNVLMAALQGLGRFDLANRAMLAAIASQGAGVWIVLLRGGGLPSLVLAVLAGWAIGVAVAVLQMRRAEGGALLRNPFVRGVHVRDALAFGVPMQAATLFASAHQQIDKFLLARLVTLATVTPFDLGFRAASALATLPQQLLLAVVPAAAQLPRDGDASPLRRLYGEGQRYVMACTAVWLSAVAGAAPRLMRAWLGPGHESAALALEGLAIAWALALATGMGTSIARGIGRTGLEARFAAVVLGVHVAASLWLIPREGLAGAIQATVLANAIGAAVFMGLLSRALAWPMGSMLVAPLVAPTLAALAGFGVGRLVDRVLPAWTGISGWLAAATVSAAGALTATVLLVALRVLRRGDLDRLGAAVRPVAERS